MNTEMNTENAAHVDQVLFDLGGRWALANKFYEDAHEVGEAGAVTRDADNLLGEIEGRICAHEAATVEGAFVKLRICEGYMTPENFHEARASALALSLARDMSSIIRTPGTLPLRPLV